MGEIILLQIGGCGNKIGKTFLEDISKEHQLDFASGTIRGRDDHLRDKIGVYYEEKNKKFIPRSVLIDLDSNRDIDAFPFRERAVVSDDGGMSGNFAKAFYAEGEEHSENVISKLQTLYEKCDRLQGFQLIHSIGGGTGAGMGSLLLNKLRDEFPDRMVSTFSVFPNLQKPAHPIEAYNAVLAINQLCENSDETFCFENEALFDIAKATGRGFREDPDTLNPFIVQTMCGATSLFRFPKGNMSCMRQIAVDMAPFPRLHFFSLANASLSKTGESFKSVADLSKMAFDRKYMTTTAATNPKESLYLSCNLIFAGQVNKEDIYQQVLKQREKCPFVEWIPNNLTIHYVDARVNDNKCNATLIANCTSFKSVFERMTKHFDCLYKKKMHLHLLIDEGMDEMEIEDASINMKELLSDYVDCIEGRPGDVQI